MCKLQAAMGLAVWQESTGRVITTPPPPCPHCLLADLLSHIAMHDSYLSFLLSSFLAFLILTVLLAL